MYCYRIADFDICVDTTIKSVISRLEPFLIQSPECVELTVKLLKQSQIEIPEGDIISNEKSMVWIKKHSGGFFSYLADPSGLPCIAVDSDYGWNECTIYYQEVVSSNPYINPTDMLTLQFIGMAFRNRIIFKSSIVLHASCIEYQGRGIAFSAPSGTGKSTHVRLWEENKEGTRVINDDAPIIRIIDGKPIVYGSPWSGSSDKFLNMSAPLSSIVLLEQAKENSIRPLNALEALTGVMPRLLLPYHDSKMMELSASTFEQIISMVPVYSLGCRPDAEAVELVYQCLM